MDQVFLSRRNLLTLLSKLDRKAKGEATYCAILKSDNKGKYPQSMTSIFVIAIEDDDYYYDREAGEIHPLDEDNVKKG